jgi:hypothetical protein
METIIIKRFDNAVEANIVKGLLESNDIFCFLQDEHSVSINPLYSNALGGIKLVVNKKDEERAIALLLSVQSEYKYNHPCPRCASLDVHFITEKKNTMNWLSILMSFTWTLFPFYLKKKFECNNCKHVFES